MKYRPDIDGLRAIGVLAVVAFHAFPEYFPGGFVGVDIFFVISGYLITYILASSLINGEFSLYQFYGQRIRRIFPALIFVLLISLLFGWLALFAKEYSLLGKHTLAGTTFLSNFYFWQESGYFDVDSSLKPLLHLWSLAIEEQFYIFWPILLWIAFRLKLNLVLWIIACTLLSFALNLWQTYIVENWTAAFFSPQTRFWELLIGGFWAIVSIDSHLKRNASISRLKEWIFKYSQATSSLGLALIAISLFWIDKDAGFPGFMAVPPIFGALLIIASSEYAYINKKIFSNYFLVKIGLISYPLYLWHWPILSFLKITEVTEPAWYLRLIALLLSFFMAWVTYIYIEKYFRFGTKLKLKTFILIVLMVILGIFGLNIHSRDGYSFRSNIKDLESNLKQLEFPPPQNLRDCQKKYGEVFEFCSITNPTLEPDIILIGDSIAHTIFYGVQEAFKEKNVLMIGRGGCAPLIGVSTRRSEGELNCQEVMNQALVIISSSNAPTVILAMLGPGYVGGLKSLLGGFMEMHPISQSSQNNAKFSKQKLFLDSLDATIKNLKNLNKRIMIISNPPRLNFHPKECLVIRPLSLPPSGNLQSCSINYSIYTADSDQFMSILSKIVSINSDVQLVSLGENFCDNELCYAKKNGNLLYMDDVHLSMNGSYFVGDIIKNMISK